MYEKDNELSKLRNLERENVSLKGELELYKTQAGQLESQLQMQDVKMKDLQSRLEKLDKQNAELMGVSDQSKFSHFNQMKRQNNQDMKKLYEIQNELAKKTQELKKSE